MEMFALMRGKLFVFICYRFLFFQFNSPAINHANRKGWTRSPWKNRETDRLCYRLQLFINSSGNPTFTAFSDEWLMVLVDDSHLDVEYK